MCVIIILNNDFYEVNAMKIRYTVTTHTTSCPHCGYVLEQESRGHLTPILSALWFITLPIMIPYWIIKYLCLGNPIVPCVGPQTITCPNCSLPVKTNNWDISELDSEDLITYRFRAWFWVSYVLGAILSFTLIILLLNGTYIISIGGLIALISLLGIVAIVVTYRVMKFNCSRVPKKKEKHLNKQVNSHLSATVQNCIYCRKCGTKLPVDSLFCSKCGTKVQCDFQENVEKYCASCGKKLSVLNVRCDECGSDKIQ